MRAATRATFAQTDENGGVILQLDPGEHRVEIQPADRSGLVPFTVDLTIPALENAVTGVRWSAPAAAQVTMILRDMDDAALEGVLVEAWRADLTPPRRIARARSSDTGLVTLSLPDDTQLDRDTPSPDAGPSN